MDRRDHVVGSHAGHRQAVSHPCEDPSPRLLAEPLGRRGRLSELGVDRRLVQLVEGRILQVVKL